MKTETGEGLDDAESYCSVEYADAYHLKYGNDAWGSLDTNKKEVLLRKGTRDIDMLFEFAGTLVDEDQALALPTDVVGMTSKVMDACAEMALITMTVDTTGPIVDSGNISEYSEDIMGLKETTKYFEATDSVTNTSTRRVALLLRDYVAQTSNSLFMTVVRG